MSTPVIPIVEHEGEGHLLQFSPSEKLVWKATAAATGGIMDQFELTALPGHFGAPEHIHRAADEFLYVLEGAFRFKVADTIVTAEAGSFLFVPRGTAHAWRNALETTSRMILTYIPGGTVLRGGLALHVRGLARHGRTCEGEREVQHRCGRTAAPGIIWRRVSTCGVAVHVTADPYTRARIPRRSAQLAARWRRPVHPRADTSPAVRPDPTPYG